MPSPQKNKDQEGTPVPETEQPTVATISAEQIPTEENPLTTVTPATGIYRYQGNGRWIVGYPRQDLSADEVAGLGLDSDRMIKSGLWRLEEIPVS